MPNPAPLRPPKPAAAAPGALHGELFAPNDCDVRRKSGHQNHLFTFRAMFDEDGAWVPFVGYRGPAATTVPSYPSYVVVRMYESMGQAAANYTSKSLSITMPTSSQHSMSSLLKQTAIENERSRTEMALH